IVDAFTQMPHLELRVIGDGPEFERIKARAGSNVRMLGHQSNGQVCAQMRRAKAFVFAAEEDFGIAPVEAQACGTPVIAYAKGGVCESVVPGETGLFFYEQTAMALRETVLEFEREKPSFSPSSIRENALRFSADYFRRDFESKVMNLWRRFVGTAGIEEPEAAENPDAVRWPRPLPASVAVSQA
ncbi:MAG TPA: glycosyltransferase, partial [Chthoniobacter sp.]|nr:glycosyltransferase [Chthoniobacter sp.]